MNVDYLWLLLRQTDCELCYEYGLSVAVTETDCDRELCYECGLSVAVSKTDCDYIL